MRVQVEWQGRPRGVVARLECWPGSKRAVLVCDLDDEGEWIVARGGAPWLVSRPKRWLHRGWACDTATRATVAPAQLKRLSSRELGRIVKAACAGGDLYLARLVCGDDPLDAPAAQLCGLELCSWIGWEPDQTPACFVLSPANRELARTRWRYALQEEFQQVESDCRFAWTWFGWSEVERIHYSGLASNALFRILGMHEAMNNVLKVCASLWEKSPGWTWLLHFPPQMAPWVLLADGRGHSPLGELQAWHDFLMSYLVPDVREDWLRDHVCVRDFWLEHQRPLVIAQVRVAPTAHERLEAKLALRAWLQNKAKPEKINQLLSM